MRLAIFILAGICGVVATLAGFLATHDFDPAVRRRFPILKTLEKKGFTYFIVLVVSLVGALGFSIWGFVLDSGTEREFELPPDERQFTKATIYALDQEVQEFHEAAATRAAEAYDLFISGERALNEGKNQQAIKELRKSVSRLPTMSAMLNLAGALRGADSSGVHDVLKSGLRLSEKMDAGEFQAIFSNTLGKWHLGTGQADSAAGKFYHALKVLENEKKGGEQIAVSLGGLGVLFRKCGRTDMALELARGAGMSARKAGSSRGELVSLLNEARALESLDRARDAEEKVRTALRKARENQDTVISVVAQLRLAKDAGDNNDLKRVDRLVSQMVQMYERAGTGRQNAALRYSLGNVYYRAKEWDDALEWYRMAVSRYQSIREGKRSDQKELGDIYNNIGNTYEAKGQLDLAIQSYRRALDHYRAAKRHDAQSMALENIGNVHERLDRRSDAVSNYEQALQLARSDSSYSAEYAESRILDKLLGIYRESHELEETRRLREEAAESHVKLLTFERSCPRVNDEILGPYVG